MLGSWVGEIVRYGILGLVLYWLFLLHLPSKDRQIAEMIAQHRAQLKEKDEQITAIIDRFDNSMSHTRTEYKVSLDTVIKYNQDAQNSFGKVMQLELDAIGKSLEALTIMVAELRALSGPPTRKRADHA